MQKVANSSDPESYESSVTEECEESSAVTEPVVVEDSPTATGKLEGLGRLIDEDEIPCVCSFLLLLT